MSHISPLSRCIPRVGTENALYYPARLPALYYPANIVDAMARHDVRISCSLSSTWDVSEMCSTLYTALLKERIHSRAAAVSGRRELRLISQLPGSVWIAPLLYTDGTSTINSGIIYEWFVGMVMLWWFSCRPHSRVRWLGGGVLKKQRNIQRFWLAN